MFNAGLVAFVIYMDYYIESMDGHKLNLQFGYIEFINRNDFTCCTFRIFTIRKNPPLDYSFLARLGRFLS